MAGILNQMDRGITSFLKELRKQRSSSAEHYAQAEQAEYEATLVAAPLLSVKYHLLSERDVSAVSL